MKIANIFYKARTQFIKYRRKVGFSCLFLAIFSMVTVHFTSLDNIFFNMFFVFLFSAILLLPEYSNNPTDFHKRDPTHPRSPFYRR